MFLAVPGPSGLPPASWDSQQLLIILYSVVSLIVSLALKSPCGKLDLTTSRGRAFLTPSELKLNSCFVLRFDLESSLERKLIYFFLHTKLSCTLRFLYIWSRDGGRIPLGNSENLDLNHLRNCVACLICFSALENPGMAEKKKLKNLIKFRDSHRSFVQKTIAKAIDLISGGNPIETRKLKLLRTSLQTKCSELQVLDREIVELLEDVSKIDSDVSESCELISVIQECMVDLEYVLTAQESQRKNQQSNSLESAETAQGHLQTVHTVCKNSNLSGVDNKFNYLKSLLAGIVQSVVAGLALTSGNYENAVLKRRFGNPQVVVSSHMEALTKIPKVASTSEVKRR